MCGLLAWWDRPQKEHVLLARQGLESLFERGPDSQTLHHHVEDQMEVFLGHTRLGLTGEHGPQPFVSSDSQVWVLVNGQFYNAPLHEHYRQQGYAFQTDTDSELLLALYLDRGIEGLSDLNGEFAAIVWDRRTNKVFAIRDRSGNKPLKFVCDQHTLMIASTARTLWSMGHPARWNAVAVHQMLAWQYPSPGQTPFAGIDQPAPGEYVEFTRCVESGTWRQERHAWFRWFEAQPADPIPSSPTPTSLDSLRPTVSSADLISTLRKAVRKRVEGSWPVAVHISGGVDSTTILALAQECMQDQPNAPALHAYGVGFEQTDLGHDESALAEKTCAQLGLPFTRVLVSLDDLLNEFERSVGVAEHPFINGHGVAKTLLSRRIHEDGFRVSLSGEGSDEAFLGYAFLHPEAHQSEFTAQFATQQGIMLPDHAHPHRLSQRLPPHHPTSLLLAWMHQHGQDLPAWWQAKCEWGARIHELMEPSYFTHSSHATAQWLQGVLPRWRLPSHKVHQEAALWAHVALGGYILPALADAPEAHHHIQGRTPFLDKNVLSLAHAMEPSETGWPDTPKEPLRQYLRTKGLHHIANRPKHPFDTPSLLSNPSMRNALRDRWYDSSLWSFTPFSPSRLRAWMDGWENLSPADVQKQDPVMCTVFSIWSMVRQYGIH